MLAVDALHVVSDLHLGGSKNVDHNSQAFNQGPRLAAFIDNIATENPDKKVALVLNGDIVDFLAEDNACYLDTKNAIEKLERIYYDESFHMVFEALERFVKLPNGIFKKQ